MIASSIAAAAANKVDTVVIGAGVVGLAVARALLRRGNRNEVILVERASAIGTGTSSRNSEVIHAGLYYPPHTLKAKLCVQGKHQLYQFCEGRNIPYRRCGKLVVATQESHRRTLAKLKKQAQESGVETKILHAEDVKILEPALCDSDKIIGGLLSPSTGILDSHMLMMNLLADCEQHTSNFTLALHTKVEDAMIQEQPQTNTKKNLMLDGMWLECSTIVNCAGLSAHTVASRMHKDTHWTPPKQYFARGNYFKLQQSNLPFPLFHHLIYPVPDPTGGLGVHATMDLQGNVRFGPDVQWLPMEQEDPDQIDMSVDPKRAQDFYESIRTYWPGLHDEALVPDYVGVRPKLAHPHIVPDSNESLFRDYFIAGREVHGIPGLVHCMGIESPGLTSSLALADYVAGLLLGESIVGD
jgi:L-2-hydroxyglutarate oxidase LhgO